MKKHIHTCLTFVLLVGLTFFCVELSCLGQSTSDAIELYNTSKTIALFEQKPKVLKSTLKYTAVPRPDPIGRFGVEVYEFSRGRLTISYSTGRCAEMNSKLGYDFAKGSVTSVRIFYFEPQPIVAFGFDLSKFRRYKDEEGGSVTFTNEVSGLVLTGNDNYLRSIDREPSEQDFEKYHCSMQGNALEESN